jgi:inhibitor of KinA
MTANRSCRVTPLGDSAVLVQFNQTIDLETHRMVKSLAKDLGQRPLPGMIEYIPAFASIAVFYDMLQTSFTAIRSGLLDLAASLEQQIDDRPNTVEIPVCYGGELGPDLEFVAKHNGLTEEEVIQIHSGNEYLVYMIGFAPGFPYLGGMSEQIATPRRQTPRLSIHPGSVGIAGTQTGVYPIETPGGWQLIGRTPTALFRPSEHPPSLLQAGDIVRFRPISREEFDRRMEQGI